MVAKIRSLGLFGIGGYEVSAEIFLSGGLPQFDLVGLPDAAVREARDRVRASIKSCDFRFPVSRVTVNLAPISTEDRIQDGPTKLKPGSPEDTLFNDTVKAVIYSDKNVEERTVVQVIDVK